MNLANGTPDYVFSLIVDDVHRDADRERRHNRLVKEALAEKKQPRIKEPNWPHVLTLIKPSQPVAKA